MLRKLILIVCCLYALKSEAQPHLKQSLTTASGLPSNAVYQTLEDRRGFLWIATDQGIARFDGRVVKVYAKEQGVPDIEVLQMLLEENGRLWIRCYNNSIAFYNQVKNRFEDVTALAESFHIGKIKTYLSACVSLAQTMILITFYS